MIVKLYNGALSPLLAVVVVVYSGCEMLTDNNFITYDQLHGKRVLVRADFNVPIQDNAVQDISRIKNIAPTINFLKKAKAKIILISHLGKTNQKNEEQSLKNVVKAISDEYKSNVIFIDDCLSDQATNIIEKASYDDLILLENLRFYKEEEACDTEFAEKLARLADFYINEAFSVSHRKHASVYEVPKFLPHALGLSFVKEINVIDNFLNNAKSPKMSIVGGAKLSTKVNLLKNLVKKVDKLALGGGIAGAFLAFQGNTTLKISAQKEFESEVIEIVGNAKEHGCELIFPIDFCALISEDNEKSIITSDEVNASIFDIGPKSAELFIQHIRKSATVLWNGPVGLFEKPPFDCATRMIGEEIGRLTKAGKIVSIVGGGDTAHAMNKFGIVNDLTYQSTSGGAFLAYLEGSKLPGLIAMEDAFVLKE
ncbi:MAG: phosphoglycerate kinase [Alphaproteobacteria bacterium]|nr:phosphoglycerate kinase [Alphaproteobacteria bacterium]